MSVDEQAMTDDIPLPCVWAAEAPVADVYERVILMYLARRSRDDGTGATASANDLATATASEAQTIRRRIRTLLARQVITRDEAGSYALLIPASWYSPQELAVVNAERNLRTLPPLDDISRPPIVDVQSRPQRADAGVSRGRVDQTIPYPFPQILDGYWHTSRENLETIAPDAGVPVVYYLYDAAHVLAYIGSTDDVRTRLGYGHLSKPWVRYAAFECADREAAYWVEAEAILKRRPYLNRGDTVQGRVISLERANWLARVADGAR